MGVSIDLGSFAKDLAALPPEARATAAWDAVNALPDGQRKALAEVLAVRMPDPDQTTANRIWLIVVAAFAVAMLGALSVLAVSVFAPPKGGPAMPETILTVFTMAASFLAGLLAPSPLTGRQ